MHRWGVWFLVVLLATAGGEVAARSAPMIEPNPVTVPANATPDKVASAITRTFEGREWKITATAPGAIDATIRNNGAVVSVRAVYDAHAVRFVYVSSEDFNDQLKDGVRYIHPSYMGWVANLVQDLQVQLGTGTEDSTPPMVAAEPATTSTRMPRIRIAAKDERVQKASMWSVNVRARLISVNRLEDGREFVPQAEPTSWWRDAPDPVVDAPAGRYEVQVGCSIRDPHFSYSDVFETPIELKPGLEYLVECVGRRIPSIRPQITPRAAP